MQSKTITVLNIICSGLLSITLAACNLEIPGIPTPPTEVPTAEPLPSNTGELCANPLYPVKQDATWTYSSTGGPAGSFSYTETITSLRADGFTLTSQFGDLTRTQEWTCKPEGLQALQLGGANVAALSAAIASQGLTVELNTSDVAGMTLPVNIPPGMQWTYGSKIQGTITMSGNQKAEANGTVSSTMQEVGTESVTVPAGTFNATKIAVTSNFDLSASYLGFEMPVQYISTSTLWYAPGVGLVKTVESGDFGGSTFSSTTELQSYDIP